LEPITHPKTNRPMCYEEIERSYPQLLRTMQWASILSLYEARDCIRALQEQRGSGEGASYAGGPVHVLRAAIRCRRAARRDRRRLASHTDGQIAPMFAGAPDNCEFDPEVARFGLASWTVVP
jgi:hypothetical protein